MAKRFVRCAPAQTGSLCGGVGENFLRPLPGSACTFFISKQKQILPEVEIKRRKHLSSIVPHKNVLYFVVSMIQKSRGSLGQ